MDTKEISDGARALRKYIDDHHGGSITAFCEHGCARRKRDGSRLKLDRVQVGRVLSGQRGTRVTVDFALEISLATDGEVGVHLWASDTLRKVA